MLGVLASSKSINSANQLAVKLITHKTSSAHQSSSLMINTYNLHSFGVYFRNMRLRRDLRIGEECSTQHAPESRSDLKKQGHRHMDINVTSSSLRLLPKLGAYGNLGRVAGSCSGNKDNRGHCINEKDEIAKYRKCGTRTLLLTHRRVERSSNFHRIFPPYD